MLAHVRNAAAASAQMEMGQPQQPSSHASTPSTPPVWNLGVYGGGGQAAERGTLKVYEYSPEGKQMPDVTVTCARKKLLVPPIPASWTPEDGDTAERLPVYQITFKNPDGPDYGGNTDFETIGTAIDRGDAVKFRFAQKAKVSRARVRPDCPPPSVACGGSVLATCTRSQIPTSFFLELGWLLSRMGALLCVSANAGVGCRGGRMYVQAFSVCREEPGYFDICAKIYPHGKASGHLFHMGVGDTIDCYVHRKGKRLSRERRPGSHVALLAWGVGITEILPLAACELAMPEPQSVRLLWSSRTRGDCA